MKAVLFIFLQLLAFCVWGQFGTPVVVSKPSVIMPSSMDLGDIDGDGIQDLVVTGGFFSFNNHYAPEKLSWFKNYGNYTFNESIVLSTDKDRATNVSCTDVDQDGDIDIVFIDFIEETTGGWIGGTNRYSSLHILFNNGVGQFEEQTVVEATPGNLVYFLNDINSDGFDDIVLMAGLITESDTLNPGYFLNDGAGQFLQYVEVSPFYEDFIVWAGMLNNDTISDFIQRRAIDYNTDSVQALLSNNLEMYDLQVVFDNCQFFKHPPTIKDINGDGYLDLLYFYAGLKVRFGDGSNTWLTEQIIVEDSGNMVNRPLDLENLNDDSYSDVLLSLNSKLIVLLMDSSLQVIGSDTMPDGGFFVNKLNSERAMIFLSTIIGDFGNVSYTFIEDNKFVKPQTVSNDFLQWNQISQFSDFNEDGIIDFVTSDFFYLSSGSNSFNKVQVENLGLSPAGPLFGKSILIEDVNSDAISDLLYFSGNGGLYYSLATENLTFPIHYQIDSFPVCYVDHFRNEAIHYEKLFFDDSSFYLITNGYFTQIDSSIINIYKYDDQFNVFNRVFQRISNESNSYFKISDFDIDNNKDFIYFDNNENQVVVDFGLGSFLYNRQVYELEINYSLVNLSVFDFNLDGFPDFQLIMENNQNRKIETYLFSDVQNSFILLNSIELQSQEIYNPSTDNAILIDIDNDNDDDLVIAQELLYPNLFYYENNNGSLENEVTIVNDSLFGNLRQLYSCDYDLDGDNDLFVSSLSTRQIILFPNLTSQPLNIAQAKDSAGLFELSPNPNHGVFQVKTQDAMQGTLNWEMVDLTGRIVFQGRENQNMFSINASHLSQGIYLLKMRTTNGTQYKIERVVIQ